MYVLRSLDVHDLDDRSIANAVEGHDAVASDAQPALLCKLHSRLRQQQDFKKRQLSCLHRSKQ